MNRKNIFTRIIALVLVIISITSIGAMATYYADDRRDESGVSFGMPNNTAFLSSETFAGLLQKSLTTGIQGGAYYALTPLFKTMGKELFGIDTNADITEIKNRLESMDTKLDDIKEEVSEGFDKVLSEIDKNNKMENAINALAKAEFISREIMNSDKTLQLINVSDINNLTPEQQRKIVEINADLVNSQQISELYTNLRLAKEYMLTGFIDTNYDDVYNIYYNYMKKQSMFCGEAANKAEPFWEMMQESYAKSCIALLYGLELQKSLYMLSESQPTSEISQEAIDAAAVAKTFGALSVIDNKIANVTSDGSELISKYTSVIENAQAEATTFINKGTVYIELKSDVKGVNISNGANYNNYVNNNSFGKDGIDEKLYKRVIGQVSMYYYHYGDFAIDMNTVPYSNFISNTGVCDRYNMVTDFSNKGTVNFADESDGIFANVMLNMKFEKFNAANKLENENMEAIVKHICENYENDSIEAYLESVGFDFEDVNRQGQVFLPVAELLLDKTPSGLGSEKDLYEVDTYNKKHNELSKLINTADPSGSFMFLEKENDSIEVNIHSVSMNGRISKGVYTITGRQIVSYDSNKKPVYRDYNQVYEVKGTKDMYFRLPENLDINTLEIKLGYEGLGASSNHENLCSYSFKNVKSCSEITLDMEGYTKVWLGYGVDASIICDGEVVASGKG